MKGAPRRAAPKRLSKAAKKRLAEAATWLEPFVPSLVTEQYPWGFHRSRREKLNTWLVHDILDPFAEPEKAKLRVGYLAEDQQLPTVLTASDLFGRPAEPRRAGTLLPGFWRAVLDL